MTFRKNADKSQINSLNILQYKKNSRTTVFSYRPVDYKTDCLALSGSRLIGWQHLLCTSYTIISVFPRIIYSLFALLILPFSVCSTPLLFLPVAVCSTPLLFSTLPTSIYWLYSSTLLFLSVAVYSTPLFLLPVAVCSILYSTLATSRCLLYPLLYSCYQSLCALSSTLLLLLVAVCSTPSISGCDCKLTC